MANKTIPELPEIDLGDLETTHLLIWETAVETFKVRASTLIDFLKENIVHRVKISVVFNGSETADKDVDTSGSVDDSRDWIWQLCKPEGGSTLGEQVLAVIRKPDADTVRIVGSDFALAAGTYTLIGVGANA